jgi:hypothetical protein
MKQPSLLRERKEVRLDGREREQKREGEASRAYLQASTAAGSLIGAGDTACRSSSSSSSIAAGLTKKRGPSKGRRERERD